MDAVQGFAIALEKLKFIRDVRKTETLRGWAVDATVPHLVGIGAFAEFEHRKAKHPLVDAHLAAMAAGGGLTLAAFKGYRQHTGRTFTGRYAGAQTAFGKVKPMNDDALLSRFFYHGVSPASAWIQHGGIIRKTDLYKKVRPTWIGKAARKIIFD